MSDVIISQLRGFLSVYGPLSVGDISRITGISTGDVTASLHILQREGYKFGIYPTIADAFKANETAQDAPEAVETGIGSTPAVKSGIGAIPAVYESRPADALEAVNALAEEYRSVVAALLATRKENEQLRETLSSRDEEWNALVAEAVAYRKLKKQLQGMLDAD